MMFALYGLLAWSMIGAVLAMAMGRAIAVCAGPEQDEVTLARSLRPARSQPTKSLESRKVA